MLYNKPCIMLKKDSEPWKNSNETEILYNILTLAYFSLLNVISESLVLISLYSISEYKDFKFLFWLNIPYISTLCNFEKSISIKVYPYLFWRTKYIFFFVISFLHFISFCCKQESINNTDLMPAIVHSKLLFSNMIMCEVSR